MRGGRNEESSEKNDCGNVTTYHSILLSSPHSSLPHLFSFSDQSQSYMTDDSTINPFYDEASWMETEELTKPEEEGTLSFQNTDYMT